MSYFKFEWKANRNFCVTAKHALDFECDEADTEVEGDGKFLKYALKINDGGTFALIGYFKTEKAAAKAMVECWNHETPTHQNHFSFLWNRKGECVDGCY